MTDIANALAELRKPFPKEAISQLPRGGAKLDYVGHAAVTDRLLSVDPAWNWEPVAFDETGMPVFERNKDGKPVGLWIRLTILGVTRLGYGTVEANKAEPVKELIGDALRNASMRFGVALDLWAKADLESQVAPRSETGSVPAAPEQTEPRNTAARPSGRRREPPKAEGKSDLRQTQENLAAINAANTPTDEAEFVDASVVIAIFNDKKALTDEQLTELSPKWLAAGLPEIRNSRAQITAAQAETAKQLLLEASF